MDAAPLIGRADALAAVRRAVARAGESSGGVLLVVGEAGVGKSRLLAEAVRLARGDRIEVLSGRATESGGAYRPLIEALLRGGVDDLDPGTVPAPYRAALGRLLPGWAAGYESAAIAPTEHVEPPATIGERAAPGRRAPHAWLDVTGRRVSTLDLFDDRLTLLAGPEGSDWCAAADRLAVDDLPLAVLRFGLDVPDPDGSLALRYGVGVRGAVLVRPDGFVAWQARCAAGDRASLLRSAVDLATGRSDATDVADLSA